MNLRNWLKKTPRPAFVQADDQLIEVPNNHRAINDLVASIKALDPSKLACLDKDKKIIRATLLYTEDDDKPATMSASAEMGDVQMFARLLAEAYDKASKANQPIIDSAMQFVERQAERLAASEREIERLRAHIHKLNLQIGQLSLERASDGGEEDGGIVASLLAGAVQGAAAKGGGVTQIAGAKK